MVTLLSMCSKSGDDFKLNILEEVPQINAKDEIKQNELEKKRVNNTIDEPVVEVKRAKLTAANKKEHNNTNVADQPTTSKQRIAAPGPKKRLELESSTKTTTANESKTKNKKFIYGNYHQYYGYRCANFHDIRLDVFSTRKDLWRDKEILDIGCNTGLLTVKFAELFQVKDIVGLDIDRTLIYRANKQLRKLKKSKPIDNPDKRAHRYPYNIRFVTGNYVLKDDVLLEIERAQFDVILCLSITKWIHLNFGDAGLKQAFRRMFLQLRPGGKLILEAQPFATYGRRKALNEQIFANYKAIKFLPEQFSEYLLSSEIGFASTELFGVPEHNSKGFKRPINIYNKL